MLCFNTITSFLSPFSKSKSNLSFSSHYITSLLCQERTISRSLICNSSQSTSSSSDNVSLQPLLSTTFTSTTNISGAILYHLPFHSPLCTLTSHQSFSLSPPPAARSQSTTVLPIARASKIDCPPPSRSWPTTTSSIIGLSLD